MTIIVLGGKMFAWSVVNSNELWNWRINASNTKEYKTWLQSNV